MENIKTREIVYKGKTKEIPECNIDPKKCEFYIVARMRYCKFDKHQGSTFCIYHVPNNTVPDVAFVECPIDPSHRVLAEKLKRHVKICNKLGEKERMINSPWYLEQINKISENENIIKDLLINPEEELDKLTSLRWEEITEEEYCQTLDKIQSAYEILKNDYLKYIDQQGLQQIINEKISGEISIDMSDSSLSLSGYEIKDSDFNITKDLAKSEKNGKQNKAISDVLQIFGLLNMNKIYIEFGAGKGGLSHYINTLTDDKSIHILIEREGVRYKRDKYSENLIRNERFEHLKSDFNIIGVAKHICGCALDMSLTCLNNYQHKENVIAVCMATCCHHICTVKNLNNLYFYLNYLKLSLREIVLLFKATSWIFGPIDINEDSTTIKSNKLFLKKGVKKNYIGLISKYVVDLARVFYLISINYKVFYLKYCTNEITTENNLILAIKNIN